MADTKLSALIELAATPAVDDEVYIRDVSEAAADESKRITIANLLPSGVPSGVIVMWHGTIANIPAGWVICDGNNATPNLLARFVQGVATAATDPGATGGAATHTLSISEMPSHNHPGYYMHSDAVNNDVPQRGQTGGGLSYANVIAQGGGAAHENEPPFYDVAFIMKT